MKRTILILSIAFLMWGCDNDHITRAEYEDLQRQVLLIGENQAMIGERLLKMGEIQLEDAEQLSRLTREVKTFQELYLKSITK